MSRFTVYRADVDSPRLARALGTVPGVAVAGEQDAEDAAADETDPPATADDGDGLRETIPVPDTDEETASVVKTYGLLGLGVSMVLLGIATVGIWVYLRRSGDEDSETPPPSTAVDTEAPTATVPEPSTAETGAPSSTPAPSVATPDEAADDEAEAEPDRPSRAEGDRSEVEWTTKDRTPASEPSADDTPAEPEGEEPTEPEESDEETRPGESIDAAPLLGVAFVAVTGAVVRWLQNGSDEA